MVRGHSWPPSRGGAGAERTFNAHLERSGELRAIGFGVHEWRAWLEAVVVDARVNRSVPGGVQRNPVDHWMGSRTLVQVSTQGGTRNDARDGPRDPSRVSEAVGSPVRRRFEFS